MLKNDSLSDFLNEATSIAANDGLILENPIADGQLHRCPTNNHPKKKNGAYIIFNNGDFYVIWYMSWDNGVENTIYGKPENEWSAKEKKEYKKIIKALNAKRKSELEKSYAEAAKAAKLEWDNAKKADDNHPYLKLKNIPAIGLRQDNRGNLLVKILGKNGEIQSLQRILPQKLDSGTNKLYFPGGKITGCYSFIPPKNGKKGLPLLICEGYATAVSLHLATGFAVLIALQANNLTEVAKMAREKHPKRQICICADYDDPNQIYTEKGGTGVALARKAAEEINAHLAICTPINDGKADFNDLFCLEDGKKLVAEAIDKALKSKPEKSKPKIIYRPSELPRIVKELENSIQGKAWQRDTLLVRIVNLPEKKSYRGLRMSKGTSIIAPFDVSDLMLLANKCADWVKIKITKDRTEEIPIDPPQTVLQVFLSAKGEWTLPPLSGLITCPIIRPDGSILDKPGYDDITGLYADFDPKNFSLENINPTKKAAEKALVILKDALSEFAFKTDIDCAVALAAILTTVLRPSVKSAPLFAFSSPTPGTGKSALANVIGIIATGRNCAAMDFNLDEAEFKKALFASLMEGSPVTLIDNVMGELNSSLLNIILSEEIIKGRVLGLSKTASLPTTSLWLATGNNLTICGDLTRRTLICTLDAEVERPAERQFERKNLEKWITDHREKLVISALTILRAYHIAGKPIPKGIKPMNGFNDWSHYVRGSLAWLGEADPKESQLAIEAHDPERESLCNVLHAWYDHFGNGYVTTKDLLARVAPDGGDLPDSQITLYQALLEAIPHGRELTGRLLGKWLARYDGRVMDGLKLINSRQTVQNLTYWKVVKL